MASDVRPPEVRDEEGGKVAVDLDFDPFESEEEFVIEESEQLSAIDEAICEGLVDKVIYEGFSDLDSDAYQALETQQNMLELEDDGVDGRRKSSSKLSKGQQRGRKPAKAAESKKRKRGDQEVDFAQI